VKFKTKLLLCNVKKDFQQESRLGSMRTPAIFALEWKRQGCELAATSSRVRESVGW